MILPERFSPAKSEFSVSDSRNLKEIEVNLLAVSRGTCAWCQMTKSWHLVHEVDLAKKASPFTSFSEKWLSMFFYGVRLQTLSTHNICTLGVGRWREGGHHGEHV